MYLSLRGEVEFDALAALLGDGLEDDVCRRSPGTGCGRSCGAWAAAEASRSGRGRRRTAGRRETRSADGHALFVGAAGCASCHADYGRQEQYRYDVWGVAVRPADLTAGDYHGGKEPADLFRRVRCGIPGAGMPAAPAALTDEQVWDLVAFVRALPVPRQLAAGRPGARCTRGQRRRRA